MMKQKFLSLVALAAAVIATACSGDQFAADAEQQPEAPQTVTLTASIGSDNTTRVGMKRNGGTASFYWHANDQITVQTKKKDDTQYSYNHFTIADGTETGATTATFKGTVDAGYDVGNYALYPYSATHIFEGSSITYNLPNEYTYDAVESNIFPKTVDGVTTYPTNSTKMPMLGTIDSENNKISFKHLGGLLVIRIDQMPAAEGTFIVSADQKLSGNFTVDDLSVDNPVITTASAETDSEKKVTFNYSNATKGSAGVFYLPVPTGDYTNLKVDVDGKTATYGSLNVNRGDVITIPVYQGTDGTSYSCDYVVNGHKFIDLCLPSGTLWAETNVGATSAADYGNYYAWGETEPKSNYSWDTYKYGTSTTNLTKYNGTDGETVLDKEDDAAYMNWGSFCRMPTYDEFSELKKYCTWTVKSDGSGTYSYNVVSNKNGNSIFLPAAGYYKGETLSKQTYNGCYLSSSADLTQTYYGTAYYFYFNESNYSWCCEPRSWGFSVRPVAKKVGYELDNGGVDEMDMNDFNDGWK